MRVRHASSGQATPIRVTSTSRAQVGRRLLCARQLAGASVVDTARAAGLTRTHIIGIEGGCEPMTTTGARDLGRALGCPGEWLRDGWQ